MGVIDREWQAIDRELFDYWTCHPSVWKRGSEIRASIKIYGGSTGFLQSVMARVIKKMRELGYTLVKATRIKFNKASGLYSRKLSFRKSSAIKTSC